MKFNGSSPEEFFNLLKKATVILEKETDIRVLSIQLAHDIDATIREEVKKDFKRGYCQAHMPSSVCVYCPSWDY